MRYLGKSNMVIKLNDKEINRLTNKDSSSINQETKLLNLIKINRLAKSSKPNPKSKRLIIPIS